MSTLHHPCIAALFQTMQLADNVYYLVTELVSGGDLCSFIIAQRYGKLEERSAKIYARQFASALAHMHSFGIVHRDLKMENVILNSTQTQIKIVDFGLSNVWSSDNPLRTHCGSPEYAAPELFIAGKEYGPEVDLWSLGIIFYGMVVGQLPFVGGRKNQLSSQERRKRLVAQINKGLGTLQRQAVAPLSPEFRAMLNKLLAPDPEKRMTAKELINHPWITEKGRRFVQTHPFKKLDGQSSQAKITKKISDLYGIDEDTVTAEVSRYPYGRLGGMYHILAHKHFTESFNLEHIAPFVQAKSLSSPDKVVVKPKSAPPLPKAHHTLYNQCVVLLNKVSKEQAEARSKSAASPAQALSKHITRVSRVSSQKPSPSKQNYSKTSSLVINRKIRENLPDPSKTLTRAASSKLRNANNKQSSGSNVKRPHTTGTVNTAPRPPKRSSVSTAIPNNRELQRRQLCLNPAGMGDASCSKKEPSVGVQQKTRPKNPLANDPIARSIAGYLLKNVPDNMFNLQMTRK